MTPCNYLHLKSQKYIISNLSSNNKHKVNEAYIAQQKITPKQKLKSRKPIFNKKLQDFDFGEH